MSASPWITEPMTAAHLPEVLAIERACFASPWPEEGFIPEPGAFWARALVLRDRTRPGAVRGYICFWLLEGEMEIQNIAVRPGDRRAGGAWHLMSAAVETAAAQGCGHAWLEVRPSNKGAIALYRRWGFRTVGRRKDYYEDGEDALIMRADLADGSRHPPQSRESRSLKGRRTGC